MNRNHFKPMISVKLILSLVLTGFILSLSGCIHSNGRLQTPEGLQLTSPVSSIPTVSTASPVLSTSTPQQTPTTQAPVLTQPPAAPFIEESKTVNGLEIHLSNIRRSENKLYVDICFPVLDKEDWSLRQLSLQYDGNDMRDWGGLVIDPIIPAADGKPGRRCDMVYFFLPDTVNLADFTISVISINAPPREGQTCQRSNAVQPKLDARGIKVVCQEGEGFAGYKILSKPVDMSQNEATQLVLEAVDFTITGPWEFHIHLK